MHEHGTKFKWYKKVSIHLIPKAEMPPDYWESFDHFSPSFFHC